MWGWWGFVLTRLLGVGAPPPTSGRCREGLQGELTLQLRLRSLGGGVAGGGRVSEWQLVLTGVIFVPVVFAGVGKVSLASGVLAGGEKLGKAPGLLAGDRVMTVPLGLSAGGKVGAVSIGLSAGGKTLVPGFSALSPAVTGGTVSAPPGSMSGGSSGDGLSPPWSTPERPGGTIASHCTSGPPRGSEPPVMAISPMVRITSCFATLP